MTLSVREPLLRQEGEPRVWVDRIALAGQPTARSATTQRPARSAAWPIALAQLTEAIPEEELAIPGMEMPGVAVPAALAVTEEVTPCGPRGWIWAGVDFLLWRTEGMSVPALVTTSPVGTPRAQAGVLGEPGTTILYGNDDLLLENTLGARLNAGLYFDRESALGIQGDYMWLETQTSDFFASSNAAGNPILARPFFNMNPRIPVIETFDPPPREDARLASYPNVIHGSIGVHASSSLNSSGLALRSLLACESFCDEQRTSYSRVDMITGYRYMQLNDDLEIVENLSTLDQLPLVSFEVYDQFSTRNQLHAIDLGAIWQGGWQRLSLDLTLKTALGYGQPGSRDPGRYDHCAGSHDNRLPGRRPGLAVQHRHVQPRPVRRRTRVVGGDGLPDYQELPRNAGLHVPLLGFGREGRGPDRSGHQPRPVPAAHRSDGRPTAARLRVPGIDLLGTRRQRRHRRSLVTQTLNTEH